MSLGFDGVGRDFFAGVGGELLWILTKAGEDMLDFETSEGRCAAEVVVMNNASFGI